MEMPETVGPQHPDRVFPLLHKILLIGVITTVVVFGIVRTVVALTPMADLVPVLRVAALAVLVGGYLVMRIVRRAIPPLDPGGNPAAWWGEHGRRALILWVVAEGVTMVGAVFWFLTNDVVVLVGVAGVALALLVMNRPSRLMEG
jgi:hypothetical protein